MEEVKIIERLVDEHRTLYELLMSEGEASLAVGVDDQFRKTLLLAIASQFEHKVTGTVRAYCIAVTGGDDALTAFVKAKGISRQYHTYFKWEGANGNTFFAMFGDSFKAFMNKRLGERADLQDGLVAFLLLGHLRNLLVHNDFATFTLDNTPQELVDLYMKAVVFVRDLPGLLSEHSARAPKVSA